MEKEAYVAIITDYVQSRDAMLACMEEKRMPDCTACDSFMHCKIRTAWAGAYNAMNAIAQPKVPDIKNLPNPTVIAKSVDWEEAEAQKAKEEACTG